MKQGGSFSIEIGNSLGTNCTESSMQPTSHPTLSTMPTAMPTSEPTIFPTTLPTAMPTLEPTIVNTPLPSPFPSPPPTAGVFVVEAESSCVFDAPINATNDDSGWTDDQEIGFKNALVASIPLLTSISDVNVTSVTLSNDGSRRHLQSHLNHLRRRNILGLTLIIEYTILITAADSSILDLANAIKTEMINAFNTTTFESNLNDLAGDSFDDLSLNAEATLTIVEDDVTVTYLYTFVRTVDPSPQPTIKNNGKNNGTNRQTIVYTSV
eukprot:CAMPEP_0114405806 /NCGR_PEP_ID=MMETSP0102-20121206/20654_1 /TAXON_ID=38822 ORGANISM="Pteridomonas danica, Strain PT" /NCGR_SAMPLE_ID=MMETSP0102 /ASSEMBLY_ACC=CAM_ASM_000212 /LENGTH=266 /DNA_ID=CAMNT_0001571329 /DNA_START=471 /DNA_END=1268 /DNA_ORIENTATION=+